MVLFFSQSKLSKILPEDKIFKRMNKSISYLHIIYYCSVYRRKLYCPILFYFFEDVKVLFTFVYCNYNKLTLQIYSNVNSFKCIYFLLYVRMALLRVRASYISTFAKFNRITCHPIFKYQHK